MILNSKELRDLAGVTRQALSAAVKSGRLHRLRDGTYDTTDPVNAEFLRARADRAPSVTAAPAPSRPEPSVPASSGEPCPGDAGALYRASRARREKANADRAELLRDEALGRLLDYDIVARSFSELAVALDVHIGQFDEREAAVLYAAAREPGATVSSFSEELHDRLAAARGSMVRAIEAAVVCLKQEARVGR